MSMAGINKPIIDPVRMLVLDCDGTLTDGGIIYNDAGAETKHFSTRDGLGIRLAQKAGIAVAVITGRTSPVVDRRCRDLGIEFVLQGVKNKLEACTRLLEKLGLSWNETAVMGDDWNDYPMLRKAVLSGLPADGCDDMKSLVHYVAVTKGGYGAVRDFIDHILKQTGVYEQTVAAFLHDLLADPADIGLQ